MARGDLEHVQRKRFRTWSPKVRTGCLTCKKRRVKCDEAKPTCLRCRSTGYKCDGYDVVHEALGSRPTFTVVLNPSASFRGTLEEKLAFDYFCKRTVEALTGNFDSEFWTYLLLRAIHVEPAIRHAALALGSLHRHYSRSGNTVDTVVENDYRCPNFPREQYGKALQIITHPKRPASTKSRDVILTVCILFICLETMSGNIETALFHVKSGLSILDELRSTDECFESSVSSNADSGLVSVDTLVKIFTRLDIQASGMSDAKPEDLKKVHMAPPEPLPLPEAFETMDEARLSLLTKQNYLAYQVRERFIRWGRPHGVWPQSIMTEMIRTLKEFLVFLDAWQNTKDRCPQLSRGDLKTRIASKLLDLSRAYFTMSTEKFPNNCTDGEQEHRSILSAHLDNLQVSFAKMVSLAEEVQSLEMQEFQSSGKSRSRNEPRVACDIGTTGAMFYVTLACRDPIIRRRAVHVLEATNSLEGLWGSLVAARMARSIIKVEEEGIENLESPSDIPPNSRVAHVRIQFHAGKTATLKYIRGDGQVFFDEISTRVGL